MTKLRFLCLLLASCFATACFAQPKVTSVDFYGLKSLSEDQIKKQLGFQDGEKLPFDTKELKDRLVAMESVDDAYVAPIQYPGNLALFIGIREVGQAVPTFRDAPTSDLKLQDKLVEQYDQTMEMLIPAIKSGKAGEDKSAGHSLSEYEPMRELQEQFVAIADEEFEMLTRVLRKSSDTDSRVAAACILAYASDKNRVVEELTYASRDPDSGVRNNAVRALSVLASYANSNPDLGLEVDPKSFIQLLSSLAWTDRNKGAAVLDGLTQQRDPKLMDALRGSAMAELEEMARWKSDGHAWYSIRILARLAGMQEAEIKTKAKASETHEARMKWVDQLVGRING